uniref:Retroviral polymerase SH3-like domain-containing protein n=1 Tax=Amphimedon queenslandica TaxID=400682 RepID=A0A1X7VGK0_AMPQE
MVCSMLASSKLPKKFWAEAISTAVYIRNRCPTKVLPDKTPFEANINRSKARNWTSEGYADQRNGYRLYDVQKERIMFSRDVTFNEAISGFETRNDVTYVQIDLFDDNECEEVFDDTHTTGDDDRIEECTPTTPTCEDLLTNVNVLTTMEFTLTSRK